MTYYQEPGFFLDQFHDESYFTGFPTDDDDQNPGAVKCFDSWSPSLQPQQQLDPPPYVLRSSSIDSSYVSPYLDSLESPFAETAGPLELQSTGSSPLDYQRYESPSDEQWAFFDSKPDAPDSVPALSPPLAATNPPPIKANPSPRGRSTRSSTATPQQAKKGGRPRKKRHPSSSSSDSDSALQKAKHAHSVIERRYRDNLNGKMMQLHRVLSAVEAGQSLHPSGDASLDDGEAKAANSRVRKSDIMTRAIGYIQRSEVQLRWLGEEVGRLREQVAAYQSVARGGEPDRFAGVQMQRQRQR